MDKDLTEENTKLENVAKEGIENATKTMYTIHKYLEKYKF